MIRKRSQHQRRIVFLFNEFKAQMGCNSQLTSWLTDKTMNHSPRTWFIYIICMRLYLKLLYLQHVIVCIEICENCVQEGKKRNCFVCAGDCIDFGFDHSSCKVANNQTVYYEQRKKNQT